MKRILLLLTLAWASILGSSCDNNGPIAKVTDYEGPMYEFSDVETYYSTKKDNNTAFLTYKLVAEKQLIMETEDMSFPMGLYIENYNPDGSVVSTIKCNEGYYNRKENTYRAVGDVVVRNLEKDQTLSTEELYWKPDAGEESIFTDKHVIINTPTETIYGDGLRATENFETYRIINPSGTITIEE